MNRVKYVILLLALVFVVALWASQPDETIEVQLTETNAPEMPTAAMPQITEADILDLFNGYAYADPDNKQAVDCVVVTDSAYDLLGIVLYTTDDYEGCSLDYIKKDGSMWGRIGVGSVPAEDTQLEYLGDGAVSCQLIHSNGHTYPCKIFYEQNEAETCFRIEG